MYHWVIIMTICSWNNPYDCHHEQHGYYYRDQDCFAELDWLRANNFFRGRSVRVTGHCASGARP